MIKLLKKAEYGIDINIDIAKGKYKLALSLKDVKKQIQMRLIETQNDKKSN